MSKPAETGSADARPDATGDALVEVDDLKTYYEDDNLLGGQPVKAVDGVNFDIERGATLGLVGESGCGKSTLGRTLVRLERATAGEVRFDGRDITGLRGDDLKEWRRNAQIVFQDPQSSLNDRMTVGEIVREPLDVHDWPTLSARVEGGEGRPPLGRASRDPAVRVGRQDGSLVDADRDRGPEAGGRERVLEPEEHVLLGRGGEEAVTARDVTRRAPAGDAEPADPVGRHGDGDDPDPGGDEHLGGSGVVGVDAFLGDVAHARGCGRREQRVFEAGRAFSRRAPPECFGPRQAAFGKILQRPRTALHMYLSGERGDARAADRPVEVA